MSGAAFRACSGLRRSAHAAVWIKTRSLVDNLVATLSRATVNVLNTSVSRVQTSSFMSTLENPLERNHKGPVVGKI